jgi:hypothetical protein
MALADVIVASGSFSEAILSHVAARAAGLSGTNPARIPNSAKVEFFILTLLILLNSESPVSLSRPAGDVPAFPR